MEEIALKDTIESSLTEIIRSGAKNAVMVNPEGFILMSIGDYDDVDEAVATYFVAAIPKSQIYLNDLSIRIFGRLLRRHITIRDIIIEQIQFSIDDRNYIGIYVEGYAIVANIADTSEQDKVRVALVRAVGNIIGILRRLKRRLVVAPAPVELEVPTVKTEIPRAREFSAELKEKFADKDLAYQYIKKYVLDVLASISEKGDWKTALQGFSSLRELIMLLIDSHSDLKENNVIQAILRWLVKTENKIQKMLEISKVDIIEEDKKEILKRGLMQLLSHLRRILISSTGE